MKLVKIGKHQLVFGAAWTTLPGADTQAKEVRSAAKEARAQYFVLIARGGNRPLVGFVPKIKGNSRKYAAAALIPILMPGVHNAVFVFNFDDGTVAAICFIDGLPMVGFDVVGSSAAVENKVKEFIKSLGEESGSITFYGDFTCFTASPSEIWPFEFADVLNERDTKSAVFQRVFLPIGLMVGVSLFLLCSFVGYSAYELHQKAELEKLQHQKIDPNIAYESNLKRMLDDAGYPVNKSLFSMLPHISKLPLFLGGWQLDSAACQLDSCSITWLIDHSIPSTFSDFKQVLPPDWSATYKSDLQTVNSVMPIPSAIKKGIDRGGLPKIDDFMVNMGSESQRLKAIGIDFQIHQAALFAVPSPAPNQPSITENVLKNPVLEGAWGIAGPWWAMEFAQSMMPNMSLATVTVKKRGKDLYVQLEGKYYVSK